MEQHVCLKTEVIEDIKDRMENLEKHDREDFGIRKELELSIKMLSKSIEEQSKTNTEMSQTLAKINKNMDLMATEIQNTNKRIDKLENKFSISESKSTIDIRDWLKSVVLKFLLPTSALGFLIYEILKSLKIIK